MNAMRSLATMLALAGWLVACSAAPATPAVENGAATMNVYVLSNGWHTAIVLPRSSVVDTGMLLEAADIPGAAFLEFGWGDRAYYMAEEPSFGMAVDAALSPSSSVIHMAGLSLEPKAAYPKSETITLKLTWGEFERLVRAVSDVFRRPNGARAKPIAPGHLPMSHFYEAHGEFHLFNTCNTWTARMLEASGIRMSPAGIVTAKELMAQLRKAIRSRPRN